VERLELIGKKLGIKEMEDWYNITKSQILENGGGSLSTYYGSSPSKLIMNVFSDMFDWKKEEFRSRKTLEYWTNKENLKNYLLYLKSYANVKDNLDWRRISKLAIKNAGGRGVLTRYGRLSKALIAADMQVDGDDCATTQSKPEQKLKKILEEIISGKENITMLIRYRHPQMKHSLSGIHMELDFWIPEWKLAFEYQGEHHYYQLHNNISEPIENQKVRDSEKKKACEELGIDLVIIPYWWNKTKEDLLALISEKRPKLVSSYNSDDGNWSNVQFKV